MRKENSKGITLIALIITIIVMLILVGVSVTVALNGGLFSTAEKTVGDTETERDKELVLSDGRIEVDGKKYASYEDYLKNNPMEENPDGEEIVLPTGWSIAQTKPAGWSESVTAITDGTNIVPLPNEYQVSQEQGENTIEKGVVITDGENEFVWIPVSSDFLATYTSETYAQPKYLKDTYSKTNASLDSQTTIDYLYGTKADGTSYYTINLDSSDEDGMATNTTTSNGTTFDYGYHYNEMVTSVNKYDGFYIGRYETTIDGNNVGSKENATVLSADMSISQTNNNAVRWWGLYDAQRKANVKGNGNIVQTNMIWGQQWDAMIAYFDNATPKIDYTATTVSTLATSGKQASGQAKYTNGNSTIGDEIYNIYDLRGNVYDWTAEADGAKYRVKRGGYFHLSFSASDRYHYMPHNYKAFDGSRLTLYIK